MSEAAGVPQPADTAAQPGLFARMIGVIFSPRATYAAVAARPRALGALVLTIVILGAAQGALFSTDTGKEALMDQQVKALESFGVNISDQMYAQMESRLAYAPYTTAASYVVVFPLMTAIMAGLLLAVFGVLMGGTATFKQIFAVVAHSGAIVILQGLFGAPLSYAKGEFVGANLGVFVPMLEDTSFVYRLLSSIDLFLVWWAVSLAIGVGVLYKRRTGGIATSLLAVYFCIVLILALVRTGS